MAKPKEPEAPDPEQADKHARMCHTLMQELAQSERAVRLHCEREAARLGETPPARALRACAEHAERVEVSLEAATRFLQHARGMKVPTLVGRIAGSLWMRARDLVIDRMVDEECAYRNALTDLRHGIDCARMLQHAADASGQVELGGFCTRWLAEREPLVETVAREMTWFALHPQIAVVRPSAARDLAASAARPN